jgi:hypothetical protein
MVIAYIKIGSPDERNTKLLKSIVTDVLQEHKPSAKVKACRKINFCNEYYVMISTTADQDSLRNWMANIFKGFVTKAELYVTNVNIIDG